MLRSNLEIHVTDLASNASEKFASLTEHEQETLRQTINQLTFIGNVVEEDNEACGRAFVYAPAKGYDSVTDFRFCFDDMPTNSAKGPYPVAPEGYEMLVNLPIPRTTALGLAHELSQEYGLEGVAAA